MPLASVPELTGGQDPALVTPPQSGPARPINLIPGYE